MEDKDLQPAYEAAMKKITDGGVLDPDLTTAYLKAAAKVYGKVLTEDEIEPDEGLIEEVGR